MAEFTPQEIEQFLQEFFDVVGARQYVGARYVPIFGRAGSDTVEWDDLAPYEPLTVVMHQGVSYVSRRYVPAGIPITDTAYWVETYRFNAQVEQYRQEVLGFQDQIDQVRTDMVDDYVPFPETPLPKYGTIGQVLSTLADGSTRWEDPVVPSDEQAEQVITQWLDDHPEATTTVQDGSVTDAKLAPNGILKRVRELQGTTKFAAYIGNVGRITFKYQNFNNGAQRVPWRLTPANATIAILDTTRTVVPFTFDQVLEAVGSSNVLTDPDGTKWVDLAAGTTMVYDMTTQQLSVQSYITSVPPNLAPVLTMGTGQFVGGLLYPKMLYDMSRTNDDVLRMYTNIKGSVSAYLGYRGSFAFKYDDFVRDGRIAWRLSSPSNPNPTIAVIDRKAHTVISRTFDQITAALGADNTITDPDGTTWANIAPGYSLLMNYSTGALSLEGYVNDMADDTAVLLATTSDQFIGGLLYPKMLHDMLEAGTAAAIEERVGEAASTSVLYSRHIPHASQVTVNPPLTLLHLSDMHADTGALGRILEKAARLTPSIDDRICTGDMVANTYGAIASWWDPSVMTCIGNHDSASYSSETGYDWTALSMADRAAYYIEPFEAGWGVTHSQGTSYYYKDYVDSRVRLIVMDVMLYMSPIYQTQAGVQTQWLQSLLSSAITAGMHVLIAIHAPHGGSTPIPSLFTRHGQGTMPTFTDCDTPQTVIDAVAAAITSGLHFVGYLCGHTHQDNMWDAAGDGSQIMYCVTCGATSYAPQWMPSDQQRDAFHDAFNIVTVDTNNSLVKIVRGGGANMDNVTRPRNGITFDYANGVKVGEM